MTVSLSTEAGAVDQPLPITVTDAGREAYTLYGLLREVLSVIENPQSLPPDQRERLAERLRRELTAEHAEFDPFDNEEGESESCA